MSQNGRGIEIEPIRLREIGEGLFRTRPFSGTSPDALSGVQQVERIVVPAGVTVAESGQLERFYWLLLEGEARAERPEKDGTWTPAGYAHAGEGFGEVPLLMGRAPSLMRVVAAQDSVLIRFSEQEFWSLLACCPSVRNVVLADMAQRIQSYQTEALHREKLVSLGTLAAGLMHELHNPGSAAKRAASQLRENLLRLQQLSLRNSAKQKTDEQLQCMRNLLEHTIAGCHAPAMSSLEQADAEEAMAEWLASAGVENAFSIAPSLVAIGFSQEELACAKDAFEAGSFSDALNWLEALVSSVSLVCAIEESISRVSELVMAVKKFAYDDRSAGKELDVHDSLQSTITILNHKLRSKSISVMKRFEASPATIMTRGSALSQVWTNLIDNAVDASPAGTQIEISTWTEPSRLVVSIADRGAGIPAEVLPHIFEAFFTTKPQGSGTGLGLEIVHRIVTQKFGGTIDVESQPGSTRFIVRLPVKDPAVSAS
ncbi:MAG TPA: ATP-binding protein [Terracidiphilus sp.]|jgi:signal transduction histidine kinase